jgi:hypothetical protein
MLAHIDKNFQTYPTHRVVAMVENKKHADEAIAELIEAGFDGSLIDESIGEDGMKFLDPAGTKHGFINKMIRKWQLLAQGEESKYVHRIEKNLKEGRAIVSVPAVNEFYKYRATDILKQHHSADIRYYGTFYVENLIDA